MDNQAILTDIQRQLDAMGDFQQVQLIVKKHRGEFRKLDAMRSTPHSFKLETDNVAAIAMILQLFKSAELAKETGAISFTSTLKDGKILHVQVQDFLRV